MKRRAYLDAESIQSDDAMATPNKMGDRSDGGLDVLVRLRKDRDSPAQEEKVRLKLRTRSLRSFSGLQILLTREDDPSFYYSLDLADEDFRDLRQRQGLLVDFPGFPSMIERLLETCATEEKSDSPKFFAVLEYNDAQGDEVTFEVQEINVYRRLAQISLRMRRGNDARVREHLGECLKQLRLEHRDTLDILQHAQREVERSRKSESDLISALKKHELEGAERDAHFKNVIAKEINDERDRAAKAIAEMRMGYETERRRLTDEHASSMRTLETRVAALDYDNRDLTEKKHKYEAQLQRIKEEKRQQAEDLAKTRAELEQHRQENNNLGQGKFELDRNLSLLQARGTSLENEKSRLEAEVKRRDEAIEVKI